MSDQQSELLVRIRLLWDNLEDMVKRGVGQAEQDDLSVLNLQEGVQLGLDHHNRFHLMLALSEGEEEVKSRLTMGIQIETKEFTIEGETSKWIDVIAGQRWRFAVEPFAADVVLRMSKGTVCLTALKAVVDEYRALWSSAREPLSLGKQRGLIAEMLVVRKLAEQSSPASVIQNWRGPSRGLHDIACDQWAVEVKAYAEEPPRVRINHIEQLDCRIDKRLTLVGVHLTQSPSGKTFPEIVEESIEWASSHGCEAKFVEQLVAARWSSEDKSEYYSSFDLGRMVVCPIRPETPVFPPALKERIPGSVTKVSYYLKLNDLERLPRNATETWAALQGATAWPTLVP